MWRLEGVEPRTLAVKCEHTIIRAPIGKLLILLEKNRRDEKSKYKSKILKAY